MVEYNRSSLQPDEINTVHSSNPASLDDPVSPTPCTAALLDTSTRDELDTPNSEPDTSSIGCFRNTLWNLRKSFLMATFLKICVQLILNYFLF